MLFVLISLMGILLSLNLIKNGSSEAFVVAGWFLLALNGATFIMNVILL